MATNQTTKLGEKVKGGIEQAQARLTALQEEAQKVVQELLEKGKASRKDVADLLQKLGSPELIDRNTLKQLSGKAKVVRKDLAHGFEDLRERFISFAGVATREQVDEIARDLDRLSKKLDKAMGAPAKKAPREKA